MAKKRFITSRELAEIVSIPLWSIQKLAREGVFPSYCINGRTYLFNPDEITALIESKKVER